MSYDDKASWPKGPWTTEPDEHQWIDPTTNLTCRIRRGGGGALCGYVAIPPSHPLYEEADRAESELDAHGGITFTGPFEPRGHWWVGFDCGHYMDLLPGMLALGVGDTRRNKTYRTFEWVKREVERLALQVIRGQDAV